MLFKLIYVYKHISYFFYINIVLYIYIYIYIYIYNIDSSAISFSEIQNLLCDKYSCWLQRACLDLLQSYSGTVYSVLKEGFMKHQSSQPATKLQVSTGLPGMEVGCKGGTSPFGTLIPRSRERPWWWVTIIAGIDHNLLKIKYPSLHHFLTDPGVVTRQDSLHQCKNLPRVVGGGLQNAASTSPTSTGVSGVAFTIK